MPIYGYTRVSSVEQATANRSSLEDQARAIRGVCMIRGEEPADILSDPGVSGSVPLAKRAGGAELLRRLRPGDVVIASKMDRMFRDTRDAANVAHDLKTRNIDLILVDMGTDPVNRGAVARMFFHMMAAFAEMERERIRERVTAGREAKARKGGFAGGKRAPFGYSVEGSGKDAVLVVNEVEQRAIELIHACHETGSTLREIVDEVWLTLGIKTSRMTVCRILKPLDGDAGQQDVRYAA